MFMYLEFHPKKIFFGKKEKLKLECVALCKKMLCITMYCHSFVLLHRMNPGTKLFKL